MKITTDVPTEDKLTGSLNEVSHQRMLYTTPEFVRALGGNIVVMNSTRYPDIQEYFDKLDFGLYLINWRLYKVPSILTTESLCYCTDDVTKLTAYNTIPWQATLKWANEVFVRAATIHLSMFADDLSNKIPQDDKDFVEIYREYLLYE